MYSKQSLAVIQRKGFCENGSYLIGYILWTMEETCRSSKHHLSVFFTFIFKHLPVY